MAHVIDLILLILTFSLREKGLPDSLRWFCTALKCENLVYFHATPPHVQTVDIHEAKTHLSRLVERAAAGEEIVIAKAGRPLARLVALRPAVEEPRELGRLKGRIAIPDDFDAPLPAELLRSFEGP